MIFEGLGLKVEGVGFRIRSLGCRGLAGHCFHSGKKDLK